MKRVTFVIAMLVLLPAVIFAEWPEDANLALKHEGGLREMNGLQWFRGYASHEVAHHRQIKELAENLT